jgi:hypothetical protein
MYTFYYIELFKSLSLLWAISKINMSLKKSWYLRPKRRNLIKSIEPHFEYTWFYYISVFAYTLITLIFRNYSLLILYIHLISYIMHKDKLFPLRVNNNLPSYLKDITDRSGNIKLTAKNIWWGQLINNNTISLVKKYRNGNARYPI